MALSSCMWTGVSGLLAHGEKMNVLGNNIANVSTVGFKGQRMDFADFVYQSTFSSAGISQIGRGVKIGAIMGNFTAGAYESTTEATDLALNGRGFFQVKKINSDQTFYTRAGNFRFNAEGYLVDPNGLAVQGWKVNNDGGVRQAAGGLNLDAISKARESDIIGSGVPIDIKLDTWTVFPQQTTNIMFKVNLPKDGTDKFHNASNPFAGLINAWNGEQPPATPTTTPLPNINDVFSTTMFVYDEGGSKHKVTIYYDKVDKSTFDGGDSSSEIWEYIVTMDPAEDRRQYWDTTNGSLANVSETKMAGVLMTGTLTFNSSGGLVNQSSYTWGGNVNPSDNPSYFQSMQDPADPMNELFIISMDPTDLNNWRPAAISTNGLPLTVANFTGVLDAQTPGSVNGYKYNIEMDFGLKIGNYAMPWENLSSLGTLAVPPYTANTFYKPNDPTGVTGPEYVLLNPDYNPSGIIPADPPTLPLSSVLSALDPNSYQYQFTNITGGYPYTSPNVANSPLGSGVDLATEAIMLDNLIQLYGITEFVIPQDAFGIGAPPQKTLFTSDASITTGIPGLLHWASGTPGDAYAQFRSLGYNPDGTGPNAATNPAEAEAQVKALRSIINGVTSTAIMRDRSVFSPAVAANANNVAEMNKPVVIDAYACTNYAGAFTASQAQNGYGYGDLIDWSVDQKGVLYGVYSNGVTLPLWQVTLYDFNCTQGLRREGNNLFSQTRYSGEAKWGPAGVAGLGTINGYTLEQSNVDMSTEFVQMITTQRGFQADSKVITTTDIMLDTVINMKR